MKFVREWRMDLLRTKPCLQQMNWAHAGLFENGVVSQVRSWLVTGNCTPIHLQIYHYQNIIIYIYQIYHTSTDNHIYHKPQIAIAHLSKTIYRFTQQLMSHPGSTTLEPRAESTASSQGAPA